MSESHAPLRARVPLAIALGGALAGLAFAVLGPQAERGLADDAGMMSFLLSESARRAPAQPSYRALYQPAPALPTIRVVQLPARVAKPRAKAALAARARRPAAVARAEKPRPREVAAVTPPPRPDPMKPPSSPLDDSTLRRGDAIMTSMGLRIFRGAKHFPYLVADFQPLAAARKVAHRDALAAIERANRPNAWTLSFSAATPFASLPAETGRSVGERRVVGDLVAIDPAAQ